MPRRPLPQRSRHRGFALMALLVLLTLGGLYFFVNNLTPEAIELRRQQHNADVLNQAKDALLGYALTYRDAHPNEVFGYLPCPDSVGAGSAQAADCGTAGQASVGLLPYQTLGLGPLRDADGNCLWYAVAANYKAATTKATPMNWDAQGQFSVADSTATLVAPEDTHGGAVAVIFAPGAPLSAQSGRTSFGTESCAVDPTEVSKYLDGNYNFAVNTSVALTQGQDKSTTNNDLLAWITVTDIFDRIVKRVDFKNAANASPSGQVNTLVGQIKINLEKAIQDDLIIGGSPSSSSPITTGYTQYSKNIGALPALAAPAAVAYATYYSNWQDQFRLVVGSTIANPTLAISGIGCRGALMFGGRGSQPRTAQEKPATTTLTPAGTITLANYFETGSGLEILNSSATSFSGSAVFDSANPTADSATCLFPGTFASLVQNSSSLVSVSTSASRPEVNVNTSNKTITLGNIASGGSSAGSGCTWLPAANFGSLLRVYFRFQVIDRGRGFTIAILDASTNNPTTTSTCGGTSSLLGYAGRQSAAVAVLKNPKIGVEFDTRNDGASFGEPSSGNDHVALLFWGAASDNSGSGIGGDDNKHGAGTLGSGTEPVNPSSTIASTGYYTLSGSSENLPHATFQVNTEPLVPYNGFSEKDRVFHVRLDISRSYDATMSKWRYNLFGYVSDYPSLPLGSPCSISDYMNLSTELSSNCPLHAPSIEQDDVLIDDPASISVSSIVGASSVANVTTSAPHGLSVEQKVKISGVTPDTYNGVYQVTSVSSPNQFTYSVASLGTYVSGGTVVVPSLSRVYLGFTNGQNSGGSSNARQSIVISNLLMRSE